MTTLELFPLTDCGPMESPSMSSAADFPAKTSALPETGQGWQANAPAYGASTPELLASFDPVSSSWKTSQLCFLEGLTTYSGTWPRSGMTRNGIAYLLDSLDSRKYGTVSGYWPTPTKSDAKRCAQFKLASLTKRVRSVNGNKWNFAEHAAEMLGTYPHPELVEWLMGFPKGWTELEP